MKKDSVTFHEEKSEYTLVEERHYVARVTGLKASWLFTLFACAPVPITILAIFLVRSCFVFFTAAVSLKFPSVNAADERDEMKHYPLRRPASVRELSDTMRPKTFSVLIPAARKIEFESKFKTSSERVFRNVLA